MAFVRKAPQGQPLLIAFFYVKGFVILSIRNLVVMEEEKILQFFSFLLSVMKIILREKEIQKRTIDSPSTKQSVGNKALYPTQTTTKNYKLKHTKEKL